MYPDWPESDGDLVPLPECPGPKLKPFDFQGPQKIEFLGIFGEGAHAIVVKVRILGQIYALKVFRWLWDHNWIGPGDSIDPCNQGQMSALYDYMEPFSAKCRAFGRLQEAGHEELAVPCFGYVLLDEEHERAMMARCGLNYWFFNGDIDFSGAVDKEMDQRRRFLGRNGRLGDFSMAITMPHFITSPELNPDLTLAMIDQMKKQTFEHCVNDLLDFDSMIHEWNEDYGEKGPHID